MPALASLVGSIVPLAATWPAEANVERLDPALDAIVSADVRIEPIHHDVTGFFEGPSWVGGRQGYLIFSDIPGNTLYKVGRDGQVRPLLAHIQKGHEGAIFDRERGRYMVGPNGTVVAPDSSIVFCVFGGGRIERLVPATGQRTTVISAADGKPLDRPNDVVIGPAGALYFTAETGIYRSHEGHVELLTNSIKPNGLAFSPDHTYFYATDHPNRIVRYQVQPDGRLGSGLTFVTFSGDMSYGFVDGIKVDANGNVFAVGPGGIWIFSPDAHHIGTVRAPVKRFSNLAFGGDDGRTLFLTAPEGVYRLQLNTAGAR